MTCVPRIYGPRVSECRLPFGSFQQGELTAERPILIDVTISAYLVKSILAGMEPISRRRHLKPAVTCDDLAKASASRYANARPVSCS